MAHKQQSRTYNLVDRVTSHQSPVTSHESPATRDQVHRLAVLTAGATLLLIVAGGLVTSNDAGDSVPDWPLSFGQVIPVSNLVGNVVYEYGHRVVAATVGLLTIILNIKLWQQESRRWVRYVGLAALATVIWQGMLGGVRVLLLEYRFPVAVIHACLAQLFFGLVVSLTVFTSRQWSVVSGQWSVVSGQQGQRTTDAAEHTEHAKRTTFYLCAAATVSIFFQLILGAAFRHRGIGIVPHIIGAVVVTILLSLAVKKVWAYGRMGVWEPASRTHSPPRPYLTRPASVAAGLLVLQLVLGVSAYLARLAAVDDPQPLEPMVSLTVAHVAVGAMILAATVVLLLRTYQIAAGPWSLVLGPLQRTKDKGQGDKGTVVWEKKAQEARQETRGQGDKGTVTLSPPHLVTPYPHPPILPYVFSNSAHCADRNRMTRFKGWAYLELTKPRLTTLILLVALAGFCLGSPGPVDGLRLLYTALGTWLLAGGIFTLNQYLERDLDAVMRRTADRPLPTGRLTHRQALWFGIVLSVLAIAELTWLVNRLSGGLALFTWSSYLFLYTPLKTRTPLCTLVGAFPGATPPLLGWAAAQGEVGVGAWVLFAILFLWQFPHFLSIGWLYREDYARAGIRMLPVIEPDGRLTGRQIVMCTLTLLPVSLLPTWMGVSGSSYLAGAVVLGLAFFYLGFRLARQKSKWQARQLLLGSVFYLPLLFALMVFG